MTERRTRKPGAQAPVIDDGWRIPDARWQRLEPLLPPRKPHPLGCHNPRVQDRKAMDGDPALRSRRLRLARAWRGDAPELLAGATLVIVGPGNLAVILAGGPPPKRVSVRSAAQGPTGAAMRRSAEAARIATLERGDLATKLARLSTKPNGSLTPDLVADLAAVWPVS